MIERYTRDDGVVIDRQVMSDIKRELRPAQVVAVEAGTVTVEIDNGRRFEVWKRCASLDVSAVVVGDWLLCCRVEQGIIAIDEVL